MRYALLPFLAVILAFAPVQAQSVSEGLPGTDMPGNLPDNDSPAAAPATPPTNPAELYTVADVNADVTADSASHARDQALMQAERAAFVQLCARLGIADMSAKMNDDTIAALVQSFEVQSEHLSSVRYIGVFTIQFKPASVQKKIGKAVMADASGNAVTVFEDTKPMPQGSLSHVTVAVQTESLAAWTQIKKRLNAAPQVARVDTLDLGRGVSHIDLSYGGAIADLQQALSFQGLVLRQLPTGSWELYDGSMVPR